MDHLLTRIIEITTWPGRIVGWLGLLLIVLVCMTVAMAQLGWNNLAQWDGDVLLLGNAITVNTLADLEWSVFAIMVLFGGVLAFREDGHVSVDFLSSHFSPRWQMISRIFGDLFLLLPFCAVVAWYGVRFATVSFNSGEASTYGGLTDRWIVKACIPLGFSLLGVAAVARALRTVLRLTRGVRDDASGTITETGA